MSKPIEIAATARLVITRPRCLRVVAAARRPGIALERRRTGSRPARRQASACRLLRSAPAAGAPVAPRLLPLERLDRQPRCSRSQSSRYRARRQAARMGQSPHPQSPESSSEPDLIGNSVIADLAQRQRHQRLFNRARVDLFLAELRRTASGQITNTNASLDSIARRRRREDLGVANAVDVDPDIFPRSFSSGQPANKVPSSRE